MVGTASRWDRCFHDRFFWLALLAGPVCWFVIWVLLRPELLAGARLPGSTWLLVVLLYPVLEEMVFRGALQGWLSGLPFFAATVVGALSRANLATSLVFTGFHFLNHSPLWAALVFFPSLVFGWAKDRYGHLTAAIVLHAFYNAGFLLLFG